MFAGFSFGTTRATTPAQQGRRSVRPALEELEGRSLLSASPTLLPPVEPNGGAIMSVAVPRVGPDLRANVAASPLGALGNVIHRTGDACQAPWVSREFSRGRDLQELRLASRSATPATRLAFARMQRARLLIRLAVQLYDAPTTTNEARISNHAQGNDLMVRAAKLTFNAKGIWYRLYYRAPAPGGQMNVGLTLVGTGVATRVVRSTEPLDPRDR